MICFDCGKKKLKGIPVIKRKNSRVEEVCPSCWKENWEDWMKETRINLPKRRKH